MLRFPFVLAATVLIGITLSEPAAAQSQTSVGHPVADGHPGGWSASCYSSAECDAKWQWHMKCVHQLGRSVQWCDANSSGGQNSGPKLNKFGMAVGGTMFGVGAGAALHLMNQGTKSEEQQQAEAESGKAMEDLTKAMLIGGAGGLLFSGAIMGIAEVAGFRAWRDRQPDGSIIRRSNMTTRSGRRGLTIGVVFR